jgi:feruloyl esterase
MNRLVIAALGAALAAAPALARAQGTDPCAALAGFALPPAAISLPTGGAVVASAHRVGATEPGNANGEYCLVRGAIRPVDPAAPEIRFQANLPAHWNGKALQFGGGGYNGSIPNTLGQPTLGPDTAPTPLARGFLTFASDSGHQAPDADDASFALNDEALSNFGWMHIRKTLDAVRAIAERRYGSAPRRVYFIGGSTGGREGLTAALRWPEAYDGVVSNYPTAAFMGLRLWGAILARAVYDDESAGWIPPAMVERIATEALARCDGLDGVTDGLVSNPAACRAGSAAFLDGLRCRNGETGHPAHCLTEPQVARTIAVYHQGYRLPYRLANGLDAYLGYNSLEGVTMQLGSQAEYLQPPVSGPNAHHVSRADQFIRNFVARRPELDLRSVDVQREGPFTARIVALSQEIDASSGAFEAFAARGGKLIWVQGNDDPSVSPWMNARLYEAVVERMGRERAEAFLRFYLIPGLAHGGGRFSPTWDSLAALDNWVENGVPPQGLVVTDATRGATRGRTRPLCAYPAWPKYRGTGDVNNAASYVCAVE